MSNDPFHSSKYSLANAKNHIDNFERQIDQFHKTDPYARVTEIDPNTGEELHKLKLVKAMPVPLDGLAVDALNNLRSALDQAVYALRPVKNSFFPIGPTPTEFENTMKGRLKHLPQEITDLIRSFKPYKGGTNLLWALNELSNTNKHGVICPSAICTTGIVYDDVVLRSGSIPLPRWDRTKNEMILLRTRPGDATKPQFRVATFIAICNVEFVDGKNAIQMLNIFGEMVDRIVVKLESKGREIGLVS